MWAACGYHTAPLFSSTQGGERRETQAVCGYHTAPLSWSMPREGKKRKKVGGMWISRCPVVFVDARWGKEGKCGQRVDIRSPHCLCQCLVGERRKTWAACGYHAAPIVFVDARRGERRKTGVACGYHITPLSSSTSGREEGKQGRCVGCTLPHCCCFPFASSTSSLPLVHPFPLHSSPPLLLDLLLLLTPLQPVVVVRDVAYTLLLDGKVAGGGRRQL